jgi:hypothetical protein
LVADENPILRLLDRENKEEDAAKIADPEDNRKNLQFPRPQNPTCSASEMDIGGHDCTRLLPGDQCISCEKDRLVCREAPIQLQ